MEKLKIITVKIPEIYIELIDELVRLGIYPSRSEAIRVAIRDFLRREISMRRRTMRRLS
ncbi:MAG: ribbon-helix-helix domain-containing protein [archaeon GB-1867-035]|nr:ribbon-helix-helix domain-containing protein [Candidatus Culexmicrobium profundum]